MVGACMYLWVVALAYLPTAPCLVFVSNAGYCWSSSAQVDIFLPSSVALWTLVAGLADNRTW